MTSAQAPGTRVQSLQRAIQLLAAFDRDQAELGVTDLSRIVGLPKSTVSRLLTTLAHEGFVERVPDSDKYRLGLLLLRLAGRVSHSGDIRAAAHPALADLSARTHETVHLAAIDGDGVVNIAQISGPHLVRETNWIGRRTPFHCAANGKALLAFQPPAAIARILAAPLARLTKRTIAEPARLAAELALARERGYACALGEVEAGLNGVAAPIRDAVGAVVAAVSVGGPAYRVTPERLDDLGAQLVEAAANISARLGAIQ